MLEIKLDLDLFIMLAHQGKEKSEIVEIIIKHAESSKLNLKAKDNLGQTAIQLAERLGGGITYNDPNFIGRTPRVWSNFNSVIVLGEHHELIWSIFNSVNKPKASSVL